MKSNNKKKRIECYVTDEEYALINHNKEQAGFTKLAPFIIHCCIECNNSHIPMEDRLFLNDFLQRVRNDKNQREVEDIFNRFNKYI